MPRTEIAQEVVVKTTIAVATKEVALDATNAGELIAQLNATKDAIKTAQDKAKALQADIYPLLGYTLVNGEWVGEAEVGTIAGNVVVKVATSTQQSLRRIDFSATSLNSHLCSRHTQSQPLTRL